MPSIGNEACGNHVKSAMLEHILTMVRTRDSDLGETPKETRGLNVDLNQTHVFLVYSHSPIVNRYSVEQFLKDA